MRVFSFRTPASLLWRAFFVFTALQALTTEPLLAQSTKRYRPQPDYVQLGTPDQEEGRRILEHFRQQGIEGDYYLEFDLRYLPRRGQERLHRGRLWGKRIAGAPVLRVEVVEEQGQQLRYLIRGGEYPAAWLWSPGQEAVTRLEEADLLKPISNTFLTPFDLQMPFLQWKDFVFEGIGKLRGRPAHRFLLYPPAEQATLLDKITAIRVSLDTQFGALVETSLLAEQNALLKTVSLMELKKVGEQWLIKSLDLRDEVSRSKTRLSFTAAAIGADLSVTLFEPDALQQSIEPPESSLERF